MKRRKFIQYSSQIGLGLTLSGLMGCGTGTKESDSEETQSDENAALFFKLSLAQWSIHKMILEEKVDPFTFAEKAKTWGFEGIEYVNHLYATFLKKYSNTSESIENLVKELNQRSDDNQVKNLLIMVDGEGDLATANSTDQNKAIEQHYKWVDAAQGLGCHSIRVNLFGETEPDAWKEAAISGLTKLSEYAKNSHISILVENHGYLSSNGALLAAVMEGVNMNNCGTLPDFGNFCLKRKDGALWGAECVEEYDKYKGVEELMPYAKAVSAKSHDFDEEGNETTIDYTKMLTIVKEAGYDGYIGVEYEGSNLSEEKGILATKDLLIKTANSM